MTGLERSGIDTCTRRGICPWLRSSLNLWSRTGRLVAVGDIHGCVDELSVMLEAISPASADTIVFLGDYVDRGPSSRDVIDRLIRLRDSGRCRTVFLRGNHEDMFLAFPGRWSPRRGVPLQRGRMTLASWPHSYLKGKKRSKYRPISTSFGAELEPSPSRSCSWHAGIHRCAPEDQKRKIFSGSVRSSSAIVTGSVRPSSSATHRSERLWRSPFKIGLDTGVYGNKLSASTSPRERCCKERLQGQDKTSPRTSRLRSTFTKA